MSLREFNTSVIPAVQNAAYAAGQPLGGLIQVDITDMDSNEGILDQIQVESVSGSTVGVVLYVWSEKPTVSTITDKANFVPSVTDNKNLIIPPTLITPATVLSAQDTHSYGAASNLTGNFAKKTGDNSLWVAMIANGSVTPGSTTDYRLTLQGIKDKFK